MKKGKVALNRARYSGQKVFCLPKCFPCLLQSTRAFLCLIRGLFLQKFKGAIYCGNNKAKNIKGVFNITVQKRKQ